MSAVCPRCGCDHTVTLHSTAERKCPDCGLVFPWLLKHDQNPVGYSVCPDQQHKITDIHPAAESVTADNMLVAPEGKTLVTVWPLIAGPYAYCAVCEERITADNKDTAVDKGHEGFAFIHKPLDHPLDLNACIIPASTTH